MKKVLLLLFVFGSVLIAQPPYADEASNYSGTWTGNQGTGFGAWNLFVTGSTGFAGHFIGNATGDSFGNIDTDDNDDFGMYGNSGDKYAHAERSFTTPLQDGETFGIKLAIQYRNGNKGIDLIEGSTTRFTFNVDDNKYKANGSDLGWTYDGTSIFYIEVTQESETNILVRITRGGDTYNSSSITTTGRLTKFKLFVGTTEGAGQNNLYANSLEIRATTPVPVELSSFSALLKGKGIELAWQTASEVNNHGFEIERKQSGTANWETLGFKQGQGTCNCVTNYSYFDNSATVGKYEYRLKQIDRDGKFEYSKSVEATIGLSPSMVELQSNYPNPFNPATTISFILGTTGKASLKVFDVLGKEVATLANGTFNAGELNTFNFDASGLPSGMYYYRLISDAKIETRKMLLMK